MDTTLIKIARGRLIVAIVDQNCTVKILAWPLLSAGHTVAHIEQSPLNILLVTQGPDSQQKNSYKRNAKQGTANARP